MNFDVTPLFNRPDAYPTEKEINNLRSSIGIGWDYPDGVTKVPDSGLKDVRKFLKRYPQHLNTLLIPDCIPGISEETILMQAVRYGRAELVDELLAMNADPNVRAVGNKSTALMYVGGGDGLRIARALLKANARIDAQNGEGETALMVKLRQEDWDIAEFLINSGAGLDIENHDHETARSLTKMSKQAAWELKRLQDTAAGLERMSNVIKGKVAAAAPVPLPGAA